MPANINIVGGPGSTPSQGFGDVWINPNNNLPYVFDGTTPKTSVIETFSSVQYSLTAAQFATATALFPIPPGETWTLTKAGIRFTTTGGASCQMGLTFDASGVAPGAGTLLTTAATILCGAGGGSVNVLNMGTITTSELPLVGPGVISTLFSGTVTGLAGGLIIGEARRLS